MYLRLGTRDEKGIQGIQKNMFSYVINGNPASFLTSRRCFRLLHLADAFLTFSKISLFSLEVYTSDGVEYLKTYLGFRLMQTEFCVFQLPS